MAQTRISNLKESEELKVQSAAKAQELRGVNDHKIEGDRKAWGTEGWCFKWMNKRVETENDEAVLIEHTEAKWAKGSGRIAGGHGENRVSTQPPSPSPSS
jgi:hypothetical protein